MNEPTEAKLHFLDYWRIIKLRIGLILLTFFLVVVTVGVTVYFKPKEYYSKVTLEVKQDNSSVASVLGSGGQRGFDPAFVATQFKILKTTEILYPVIERLDLIKELSPPGVRLNQQQIYARLQDAVKTIEVRGTSMIEIGVFDTDAQRAANIANMIAVVYQESRRTSYRTDVDTTLENLRDEVEKKRKSVEESQAAAMTIRQRDGIMDSDPDKDTAAVTAQGGSFTFNMQQLNEQRVRVLDLERQLEWIKTLRPDEVREAFRVVGVDDPVVSRNLPLLQDAQTEEARLLNSGLGPNHPKIRSLSAQKEMYSKMLADQLVTLQNAQTNKLRFEKDKLADLDKQSEASRAAEIQDKSKVTEYIEAKNKYLAGRRILDAMELNLSSEGVKRQFQSIVATVWQKAEKSDGPARPNIPRYMMIGALVGAILGIALAFFIEYLDTSVKSVDDVEKFLKLPVLAVVPTDVSVLMRTPGDSSDAEAYRILRAAVEFNKPYRDANTFTLISGGPGEGKSTTLNNLAYTCARGGYNVLVVDADLRRASQHNFFGVDNTYGLTDYLLGRAEIDEIIRTTTIDNLSFIPAGQLPNDAVGILNSQRMTDLIAKVKGQYDLVFFDSPPILGVSDGSVLASEVDITIMVVQHRRFPRAMLQRVKQAVLNVGGRLIGVVLNNVNARHDDGYAYYDSYNEYYSPRRPAPKIEAPKPQLAVQPRPSAGDHEEY